MDSRISARGLAQALGGWRTREPAYEALADGIRVLCLDNRLAARTALPAERELAAALKLSRATVASAYRSLRASGHIESTRGSGSVTVPQSGRDPYNADVGAGDIDLQQASPAAWPGLAGVMSEAASDAVTLVARKGYDVRGSFALRAVIADRYVQMGVPTQPNEIMVTTGAQAAIHLLAETLLRRGDRVIVETPTYPHAADALRGAGGRLVSVPVSVTDGWDIDRAVQAFGRTMPRLAYLMPRFQNPTGSSMDAAQQGALAQAASDAGTTLVIDETTADLAIDGEREPAIFAGADLVRVGSFGKTVWGGLRVGWIRADSDLIDRVVRARPPRDLGTPEFEQAVARRVLERMPEVLEQRAAVLREGRDGLTAALREAFPSWRVPDVSGGVALWVELDAPLSSGLVLAAREHGVHLSAGSRFAVDGSHDRHLRVPFTAPLPDLLRAVGVLAAVWPTVRAAAPADALDPRASLV